MNRILKISAVTALIIAMTKSRSKVNTQEVNIEFNKKSIKNKENIKDSDKSVDNSLEKKKKFN